MNTKATFTNKVSHFIVSTVFKNHEGGYIASFLPDNYPKKPVIYLFQIPIFTRRYMRAFIQLMGLLKNNKFNYAHYISIYTSEITKKLHDRWGTFVQKQGNVL